jgi:hypothetical protein
MGQLRILHMHGCSLTNTALPHLVPIIRNDHLHKLLIHDNCICENLDDVDNLLHALTGTTRLKELWLNVQSLMDPDMVQCLGQALSKNRGLTELRVFVRQSNSVELEKIKDELLENLLRCVKVNVHSYK